MRETKKTHKYFIITFRLIEIERKLLAPKLQTISNFFLRKNFDRSAEFSAAAAKLKKKQFEVF